MPAAIDSSIIDTDLSTFGNADQIFVCSSVPTTFTEATSVRLGAASFGVGLVVGAPQNATPNGRRVLTSAVNAAPISSSGIATAWAIVDTPNQRLLAAGTLFSTLFITTGQTWSLPAFEIRFPSSPAVF